MLIKSRRLFAGVILLAMAMPLAPAVGASEENTDRASREEKPRLIKLVPPVYPNDQSQAGLTGEVLIEFIIDTEGMVHNARVVRSNNPAFERPALDAVSQWKFTPGRIDGRPVNVRAAQPIVFNLDDTGTGRVQWRIQKGKNHASLPPEMQWETAPEPINTAFPVYPFAALQSETKGTTELSFVIGPKGRVIKATVVKATTPEMGQAVLAMIDTWEFTPARKADGTLALAAVSIAHTFDPFGRGDAPVTDSARSILRRLAKHPEEIIAASQLDRRPKPVSRRAPVYPLALQAAGQPGEALIEFYIDENGDAQLPRIVSSSALEFGYAAAQAVAAWRFEPPTKKGKRVVTRVQVPMEFNLEPPQAKAKP